MKTPDRHSILYRGLTRTATACSADWQSAVSQVGNLRASQNATQIPNAPRTTLLIPPPPSCGSRSVSIIISRCVGTSIRVYFTAVCLVAMLFAALNPAAAQGNLNPPGAPAPMMKTLSLGQWMSVRLLKRLL